MAKTTQRTGTKPVKKKSAKKRAAPAKKPSLFTKAELLKSVEKLMAENLVLDEKAHQQCCEKAAAREELENHPWLIRNMVGEYTLAFNRLGIGIKLGTGPHVVFTKNDVETRVHYTTILRLGMIRVFQMFDPLFIKGMDDMPPQNDAAAQQFYDKAEKGNS
jgi:hypothetical protein